MVDLAREAPIKAPLSYEKIRVRAERIELLVRVSDKRFRMTTPELIKICLADFSLLPQHACRNHKGKTFASVMENTSVPHLLEHLIVHLQLQAEDVRQKSSSRVQQNSALCTKKKAGAFVITGSTQWSASDDLLACVSVSFADDIIALAACKEALNYLNNALLSIEVPLSSE